MCCPPTAQITKVKSEVRFSKTLKNMVIVYTKIYTNNTRHMGLVMCNITYNRHTYTHLSNICQIIITPFS